MYAPSIQKLIDAFCRLPGIGPKTAERFVFYLLKKGKREVNELTTALNNVLNSARSCKICFDFTEQEMCSICSDSQRDKSIICVVADPQDIQALERSGAYNGLYHVLRGTLDPARSISAKQLTVDALLRRLPNTKEVILALNPDMQGETTSLFLQRQCSSAKVTITRLARGLPLGSDLDYADELTLTDAIKGRQQLQAKNTL